MRTAAIDVVVPVYNAASTLDESLSSIALQTFDDFRVIAVDDGSTDESARILNEWAAKDERFTVIRKRNAGIVEALNEGLAAVTAPLIARMDGDDISAPQRFARQREWLLADPHRVAVGCAIEHIDEHGGPLHGLPQPGAATDASPERIPAREPYIVHPFLMARTEAVKALGGYRHVPNSEDSDLFWRLEELGDLHNLPDTLGKYRLHLNSISSASIVNGRIMAVGSQLGSVSARRRRSSKRDLTFDRSLMQELRKAEVLESMCAAVLPMLEDQEVAHFRLAVAIKLLELARYRPFAIEPSDCRFAATALPAALPGLNSENRKEAEWYLSDAGGRLLRGGRLRDAGELLPSNLVPKAALKALVGFVSGASGIRP